MRVHTVAALEASLEFDLGQGRIDLGAGVYLERLPAWIRHETNLNEFGRPQRNHIKDKADYALISEDDLDSFDELVEGWKGDRPRLRAHAIHERIRFTEVSMWLQKPSNIEVRAITQAVIEGNTASPRQWATCTGIALFEEESTRTLSRDDLEQARRINESINALVKPKSMWMAVRALLRALLESEWEFRYLGMWIVLETLFGAEDPTETTHKLTERISVFVEPDPRKREALYKTLKKAYRYRCKIAHGDSSKIHSEESLHWLKTTEHVLRPTVRHILLSPELVARFSDERDRYLFNRVLGLGEMESLPKTDSNER